MAAEVTSQMLDDVQTVLQFCNRSDEITKFSRSAKTLRSSMSFLSVSLDAAPTNTPILSVGLADVSRIHRQPRNQAASSVLRRSATSKHGVRVPAEPGVRVSEVRFTWLKVVLNWHWVKKWGLKKTFFDHFSFYHLNCLRHMPANWPAWCSLRPLAFLP